MTARSVTQVNPYYKSTAAGRNPVKNGQAASGAFTDCFSGVCGQQAQASADARDRADNLNKAELQPEDRAETQTETQDAAQTQDKTDISGQTETQDQQDVVDNAESGTEQTENTDAAAEAGEAEDIPETEEGTLDKIEAAAERMIAEIAAQLGMTVEQVHQAMQNLGMKPEQALEGECMKQLVMELSGAQGEADLLTDEGLYNTVKELARTLEQVTDALQKELNLSAEQLETMLKQTAETGGGAEKPEGTAGNTKPDFPPEPEALQQERAPIRDNKVQDSGESVKDGGPVAVNEGEQSAQSTGKPQNTDHGGGESGHGHREEQGDKAQGFLQQTGNTETAAKAVNEVFFNPAESARGADTESIMKQIMDYMKIQVKADTTQLELQLHPASLGTVGVQIAAKEGVVTAQFTAQNEAVKNALEAQIVQLKENLNEQGVKVEAVEVTIASHEFERNLQQNSSSGEGNPEESGRKKARRINLNLDGGLETAETGMDEADKLAADMMARNGNTVDFSA